jgi:hypothetical protein
MSTRWFANIQVFDNPWRFWRSLSIARRDHTSFDVQTRVYSLWVIDRPSVAEIKPSNKRLHMSSIHILRSLEKLSNFNEEIQKRYREEKKFQKQCQMICLKGNGPVLTDLGHPRVRMRPFRSSRTVEDSQNKPSDGYLCNPTARIGY